MTATLAHCSLCFDTSPHCECRKKGNKYWAEGFYQYTMIEPCGCHLCKQQKAGRWATQRHQRSNRTFRPKAVNGGPLDRWLAVLKGLE